MGCRGVIFDLDGTLLDTLDDLAAAANRALALVGCPGHDRDAYRWFVGDGAAVLIQRALPEPMRIPAVAGVCLRAFLEDYNRNWKRVTHPYEGIPALLDELVRRGTPLAVVTNKPHVFAEEMVAYYFGKVPFKPILGQREGIAKKPDPGQALEAAQVMGIAPRSCIFLGDSAVDMQTGLRAGMRAVGAGWGFRPVSELQEAGACQVIRHPLELLEQFENAAPKAPGESCHGS